MRSMNLKQKIVTIYFVILPFMDLITSLLTRVNVSLTLGTIVKGITLIISIVYIIFFSKSQYKIKSIILLVVFLIFGIIYFWTKIDILNFSNLKIELVYAFKFLYFPLMFIGLVNIFDDFKIDSKIIKKILLINCFSYTLLLLIPYFTNTAFNSYNYVNEGFNGWFYAANEISTIVVMLSVIMYDLMDERKKYKILLTIPIIYSICLIGTKVSFFGIIIVTLLIIFFYILKNKKIFLSICLLIVAITCCYFSSTISNMNNLISVSQNNSNSSYEENRINNSSDSNKIEKDENKIEEQIDIQNDESKYEEHGDVQNENIKPIINKSPIVDGDNKKIKFIKEFFYKLSSGRMDFFYDNFLVYKESGLKNILFGLGWSDRENINYTLDKKLIEVDILDILIHYGVIGIFLYFLTLIYLAIKLIINLKYVSSESIMYIFLFLLSIMISIFAGHVLGAPAVSIYLDLILLKVVFEIKENKNNFLKQEKI